MEAIFGVIAIALLSWMLIWMTSQVRLLKAEIEGNITSAIQQGNHAGWGVFGLIFIAVLREGFETVVFISCILFKLLLTCCFYSQLAAFISIA